MNSQGSIQDLVFLVIFVFVISIVGLLVFKISDEFTQKFTEMDEPPQMAKDGAKEVNSMFSSVMDTTFLIVVIGIAVAAIALAALVRVHPVFIIFFIFALVILIVIAMTFANMYDEMAKKDVLKEQAEKLTFMSNVMIYLPWFVAGLGTVLAIVMYKTRGGPVQVR